MSEKAAAGWKMIDELAGERGIQAMKTVEEFSPRLAKLALEFGYGDVYLDDALDKKQRALITLSSLITQGDNGRGLTYHFNAALRVGVSKEEILELINHCSAYAGFPKAIHAVHVFKDFLENQQQGE
ncbi:carboxymuconolactone decarboxylase family protein [Alkalicoccobacillus murimartini]|jgi:4-carboxymuconolactone decarboxylase|uniref:4-carboxymuconolactone decarboxylase n=1 Tax=Alkalicoccobacillus murimartini TaxID=171685 RepID=A0ABT9YNL7_9BACI|nr:carboxymuconolactone decarboxylase family protein [Alkalicoccobacillus murimartini]MDQ0209086.1 4-carboxymuconolactone decarboxylase [Alkalicoccobacillus murimartini]